MAFQPRQQTPPSFLITTAGYYKESIPDLGYSQEIVGDDVSCTSLQTYVQANCQVRAKATAANFHWKCPVPVSDAYFWLLMTGLPNNKWKIKEPKCIMGHVYQIDGYDLAIVPSPSPLGWARAVNEVS